MAATPKNEGALKIGPVVPEQNHGAVPTLADLGVTKRRAAAIRSWLPYPHLSSRPWPKGETPVAVRWSTWLGAGVLSAIGIDPNKCQRVCAQQPTEHCTDNNRRRADRRTANPHKRQRCDHEGSSGKQTSKERDWPWLRLASDVGIVDNQGQGESRRQSSGDLQ